MLFDLVFFEAGITFFPNFPTALDVMAPLIFTPQLHARSIARPPSEVRRAPGSASQ